MENEFHQLLVGWDGKIVDFFQFVQYDFAFTFDDGIIDVALIFKKVPENVFVKAGFGNNSKHKTAEVAKGNALEDQTAVADAETSEKAASDEVATENKETEKIRN